MKRAWHRLDLNGCGLRFKYSARATCRGFQGPGFRPLPQPPLIPLGYGWGVSGDWINESWIGVAENFALFSTLSSIPEGYWGLE
jgi:hypothetical protein